MSKPGSPVALPSANVSDMLEILADPVRYQQNINELKAIRAANGLCVRIDRPGSGLKDAAGDHVSETEMDGFKETDFDAVIVNNGTLDQLEVQAMKMLDVLMDKIRKGEA